MSGGFAFALHGGAFGVAADHTDQNALLMRLLADGRRDLAAGASALDVCVAAVAAMEDSGLFVAGRGSGRNAAGYAECDAAVMDGATRKAGAVAGLRNVGHPVHAARLVMDHTRHVLLAGEAAVDALMPFGLVTVDDPASYFSAERSRTSFANASSEDPPHGTVGAVACDCHGRLAAATSTGGTRGKLPGRIGDTPIIGAGTYADSDVAVSCTGVGEYFMRHVAAYDVAARVRYSGLALDDAVAAVLRGPLEEAGGRGGLIAVSRARDVALAYNDAGMMAGSTTHNAEPRLIE